MKPQFGFTDELFNTQFAPLCVVGHVLREQRILEPLLNFGLISQKKRDHTPGENSAPRRADSALPSVRSTSSSTPKNV